MTKSDWCTIALMAVGMMLLILAFVWVIEFVGDVIWAFRCAFGG